MRRLLFLHLFFFFASISLLAQVEVDTTAIDTDELIETWLQDADEDAEQSDFFENFEYFLSNPIEVNSASVQDFLQIPIIDLQTAELIVEHRKKFGDFFSVNELFSVQGINHDLVRKIIPFLYVKRKETTLTFEEYKPIRFNLRSRIITDLQTRRAFLNDRYEGSKLKSYNRLQVSYDKFRLNLLTEKDPGEKSYYDFFSYSLSADNYLGFERIIVGNYQVEFGNGLVLWSPYGLGKSAEILSPVSKKNKGIKQHTGSDENNYFRGLAASTKFNKFTFTLFLSNSYFDASIDTINNVITSFPNSGYHRTTLEISRKHNAYQNLIGGKIDYSLSTFGSISALYYKTDFSTPLKRNFNGYLIEGKTFSYSSIAYDLYWSGINITGETAFDGISAASIVSVQYRAGKNINLVHSVRSYPRNFRSLYGAAFGEQSNIRNEIGFYNGLIYKTVFGIFKVYYDLFQFPYTSFSSLFPSNGEDFLIDYQNSFSKKIQLLARYKRKIKEIDTSIDGIKQTVKQDSRSYRCELIYSPNSNLRLRFRGEHRDFSSGRLINKEKGMLFFHDIMYKPTNQFTLNGRIIFFRTDSFNSAVYEYENDLTGVLSNLPMYGEGIRWYLMLKAKVINNGTVSFKYSETFKPKEKKLSSGDSEIATNIDNRFSLQIDITF